MKILLVVTMFFFTIALNAQTLKPDEHGVIYSNPSNPHLTKTQESDINHEAQINSEQQKHRRFAFGPQLGAAFISDVKGFEMNPAFSLGIRSSYDIINSFLAVGLNLNVDFIHFSDKKDDTEEAIDLSAFTYMLFLDFKPFHGMHFGPYFGLSNKAYAFRKEGFLSHRDKKGTDNYVAAGGFFGWDFKLGKRFYLGPRLDVINYAPFGRSYMTNHLGVNFLCATKWTF